MTLYVVATPVGNLEDVSRRALRVLGEVDTVLAEDTRVTGKLLSLLGVSASMRPYHDHTDATARRRIVDALCEGASYALVSDAGTPCVSDPGYALVRDAAAAGVSVVPVPGASSVMAFLAASGLPSDRFQFVGFAPRKAVALSDAVREWTAYAGTTVLLESPKRLVKTVQALADAVPDRELVVGRELTKMHEEFIRGPAADVARDLGARDSIRGECVLGFSGAPAPAQVDDAEVDAWIRGLLAAGVRTKPLAALLAERLGLRTADVYQRALSLKDE